MNNFPWKLALGVGAIGTVAYVVWKRSQPSTAAVAAPAVAPSSSATPFAATPTVAPSLATYSMSEEMSTSTDIAAAGYAAGVAHGIHAFNDHAVSYYGQSPEFHRTSCKCDPANLLEGPYAIDVTKPLLWKTSFRAGFMDGWSKAKAGLE